MNSHSKVVDLPGVLGVIVTILIATFLFHGAIDFLRLNAAGEYKTNERLALVLATSLSMISVGFGQGVLSIIKFIHLIYFKKSIASVMINDLIIPLTLLVLGVGFMLIAFTLKFAG